MMQEIIKDKAIVQDDWTVLRLAENETPDAVDVPAGKVMYRSKSGCYSETCSKSAQILGFGFPAMNRQKI
jgi:hypothetical protein